MFTRPISITNTCDNKPLHTLNHYLALNHGHWILFSLLGKVRTARSSCYCDSGPTGGLFTSGHASSHAGILGYNHVCIIIPVASGPGHACAPRFFRAQGSCLRLVSRGEPRHHHDVDIQDSCQHIQRVIYAQGLERHQSTGPLRRAAGVLSSLALNRRLKPDGRSPSDRVKHYGMVACGGPG